MAGNSLVGLQQHITIDNICLRLAAKIPGLSTPLQQGNDNCTDFRRALLSCLDSLMTVPAAGQFGIARLQKASKMQLLPVPDSSCSDMDLESVHWPLRRRMEQMFVKAPDEVEEKRDSTHKLPGCQYCSGMRDAVNGKRR